MRWAWAIGAALALGFIGWAVWPTPESNGRRVVAPPGALAPSAGPGGETASCLGNLRNLSGALMMYAADHDGRLAPADRWSDATSSYGSDAQVLHCPSVPQFGYAFARSLGAKKSAQITHPDRTPMLFDSTHLAPNANDDFTSLPSPPRHTDNTGGKANLGAYADGHAGWLARWR